MNDRSISASSTITTALWAWAFLLLLSSWGVMAFHGPWELAAMLGFSTCVFTGVAATSQIRCYTLRMCQLIRVAHGLEYEPDPELRAVR